MKPIISIENLAKRYRIRDEAQDAPTNAREMFASLPRKLLNGPRRKSMSDFWALRDVNADIMAGDRVGIIGRNGAGKSTLLKLLSRITEPTAGRITLRGRVASLLEVGTGFHPELTGRENIFLNGAILGMSKAEVQKKFDEIVDFAGVEMFLDTPVKRYSSGMYVRLGFAVAAHLEPDILIVDEVLAVGDIAFQKKCLGKMEEVSKGEGRTVIFVSHQMAAVRQLCQRCLLLDAGRIIRDGTLDEVVPIYLSDGQSTLITEPDLSGQPDDPTFKYHSVKLSQKGSSALGYIAGEVPLELTVDYSLLHDVNGLRLFLNVENSYGELITQFFFDCDKKQIETLTTGRYISSLTIPNGFFGPTNYVLRLRCGIYNIRNISYEEGITFKIRVNYSSSVSGPYSGDVFRAMLNNQLPWETMRKDI